MNYQKFSTAKILTNKIDADFNILLFTSTSLLLKDILSSLNLLPVVYYRIFSW